MTATSFPRKTHSQNGQLGRSSGSRIKRLSAPSRGLTFATVVGRTRRIRHTVVVAGSSPVTAAGPQRNCTVFPILLPQPQAAGDTQVFACRQLATVNRRPHRSNRTGEYKSATLSCVSRRFFTSSVHPDGTEWNRGFVRNQFDGACSQIDDGPVDVCRSGPRTENSRNPFC